jgi:hypothetical protein
MKMMIISYIFRARETDLELGYLLAETVSEP